MSRARILADYVSSGDELADKAPLASPDFTGTVDLTGTTVSLDDDEISLDKVNGGTLGTGTIGGSSVVSTSGAITTTGAFTSIGIDDNANANAVTITTAGNVAIGDASHAARRFSIRGTANDNSENLIEAINLAGTTLLMQSSDGDLQLKTGNLVIGTAGKGITFSSTNTPAQSSGTGTHNTLDDYEEGTWTPSFAGSQPAYSAGPYGKYVKIGRMVYCHVELTISSWSGGNSNATMTIPFATESGWYGGITSWTVDTNFTDTGKKLTGWESASLLYLYKTDPGNSMHHSHMNVNVTGRMSFAFNYKADS